MAQSKALRVQRDCRQISISQSINQSINRLLTEASNRRITFWRDRSFEARGWNGICLSTLSTNARSHFGEGSRSCGLSALLIDHIFIVSISPAWPGLMVQQPNGCSTAQSIKQLLNINGQLGMLVFMGKRSSQRDVFWDVSRRLQFRWMNRQIAGGCFKQKGC